MSVSASSSRRNALIIGSVVLFHAVALWALQTGLLRRAVEVLVPVQVLSEFIQPDPPRAPVPPPKTQPLPPPPPPASVAPRQSTRPPAPQPLALADATPAANAPTGLQTPQALTAALTAPVAAAPVAAPAAAAKVELPSADADYLNNPKAPYPRLSKTLGEQGRVLLRVLIGVDGSAQKAEIKTSSGFDRLDQSALATALKWRYVPGKRAGVAETMWYIVPFNFVLE